MFDSSGDNGPPCGVPSVVGDTKPASMTPASRYRLTSLSTRLSFTVRATRAISTSWFTRSKNFSRSMSTTHRLPPATYSRAFSTASWALRPGRNP